MPITNSGNRDFGSVFRPATHGGPRVSIIKNINGLPNWPDLRRPGNTDSTQVASRIMDEWDINRTKRFEIFMERFYTHRTEGPEPWRREWLEKTTGNFIKSGELKIVKCKLELIKRLLIIKILGPQSLEDWVLLFLYYDNELAIPPNIEELMRPESGQVDGEQFLKDTDYQKPHPKYYAITAPNNAIKYPGNMPMHGFGGGGSEQYDRPRITTRYPATLTFEKQGEIGRDLHTRMRRFPAGTMGDTRTFYTNPRLNNNSLITSTWFNLNRPEFPRVQPFDIVF